MNSWSITGHLGKDPEPRVTNSGKDVLNLRVALKQRVYEDGKWVEQTEWVDVSMFGQRTKWLAENLRKGMRIGASGEMRVRRYTTGAGEAKVQIELMANDIEPLDRAQQDDAPRTSRPMPGQGARPQHRERQGGGYGQGGTYGGTYGGAAAQGGGYGGPSFGDDDDIPF